MKIILPLRRVRDHNLRTGLNSSVNRNSCYFSFQPVLHDWCNEGRGMCYPVYGMVQSKIVAHVIEAAGFLFDYLSGPLPYV